MSTPLGHSLAGLLIRFALGRSRHAALRVPPYYWAALLAVAPDLDFIPGILIGSPARYHQGVTHSLLACFLVAVLGAFVGRRRNYGWALSWQLCFLSYGSHLLLDLLTVDGRPPYGLPLLWPFSERHFQLPIQFMPPIRHVTSASSDVWTWLTTVISMSNLFALAVETGVFLVLLALLRGLIRVSRESEGR